MKVKVGDVVTFRCDLIVGECYDGVDFLQGMSDCRGRKFKVERLPDGSGRFIRGSFLDNNQYCVYIFSTKMLIRDEPLCPIEAWYCHYFDDEFCTLENAEKECGAFIVPCNLEF